MRRTRPWTPGCGRSGRELRADRAFAKAIGFRYHDGKPSMVEGLLSRGDRRVAKVILAAWQDGARFDGWSETFSFERWERCAAAALADDGVDLAWYTTRERAYDEVLPWDHLDAGLDRDWLWQDWLAAIDPAAAAEVEDCRWTPCFECGVCPAMDTEIQIGPTGRRLLPLTVPGAGARSGPGRAPWRAGWRAAAGCRRRARRSGCGRGLAMGRQQPTAPPPPPAVQRLVIRYAKRGRMRFASHRDIARAVERGVREAGLPVAYSAGFSPHPKISYQGGAPTGAASEAEYLEISLAAALRPGRGRGALDAALPDGIDVIEVADLADAPAAAAGGLALAGGPARCATAGRGCGGAGVPRRRHAEVERLTSKRSPAARRQGRGGVDGAGPACRCGRARRMCDTSNGCSAHDTCRPTRRHPGSAPPHVGSRAVVTPAGDAAGAGTARR